MPQQTQDAVNWAKTQTFTVGNSTYPATSSHAALVGFVRQYFNGHGITYSTFSYTDIQSYL